MFSLWRRRLWMIRLGGAETWHFTMSPRSDLMVTYKKKDRKQDPGFGITRKQWRKLETIKTIIMCCPGQRRDERGFDCREEAVGWTSDHGRKGTKTEIGRNRFVRQTLLLYRVGGRSRRSGRRNQERCVWRLMHCNFNCLKASFCSRPKISQDFFGQPFETMVVVALLLRLRCYSCWQAGADKCLHLQTLQQISSGVAVHNVRAVHNSKYAGRWWKTNAQCVGTEIAHFLPPMLMDLYWKWLFYSRNYCYFSRY